MIDERHEELATLYALDQLEGDERVQFETALARDPTLQALVRELRAASSALAHTASTIPPATLKERVFASIAAAPHPAGSAQPPTPSHATRPESSGGRRPSLLREFLPWAIAAGFALVAAWTGVRYKSEQSAAVQLRREHALADVALQGVRQQLEAERIVTRRQLQVLDQQVNEANTRLAQARTELERATANLAAATNQTGDRARRLTEAEHQLGLARAAAGDLERQLADRERQAVRLTQRIEALTAAGADITHQLESARNRIAQLTAEMELQRDIADFKITVLASMVKDNPQALAVAVWDPTKKEGVLQVEKLPALRPNQDYQLWVVDPQYPDPVDGGVFNTDPQSSGTRFIFKPRQPVSAVNAFAISRERKGGVAKAEGPIVLLGK